MKASPIAPLSAVAPVALLLALTLMFSTSPSRADDVTAGAEPFSLRDPGEQSVAPATQPAAPSDRPQAQVEGGLVEYIADRFSPHEPMYFVWGPDDPKVKFQVSLKYQIFSPQGSLQRTLPTVSGLYGAYTQQSFWNTGADSGPFYDSSYKPEVLWLSQHRNPKWLPGMTRFDFQLGLQHESNGKDGADSRSLNIAYVRPVFTFGQWDIERGFFVTVGPRAWSYVGSVEDNPDIADYRGNFDLRLIIGWRDGLQLSSTFRPGQEWDRIALELNLSYPIGRFTGRNLDMYLYAQYFTGYGESLLDYNENGDSFRIGLAVVR